MKNIIKNKIPIDIDLAPNRDKVYSGIGIKTNDEIYIFVCFNEDSKEFDGYAIVRSYEIEKYRKWDNEELGEIKLNNSNYFIEKLPVDKMDNMHQCLTVLKSQNLIAIFTESDNDSYFVGEIKNVSEKHLELKLMNEDAEWIGNEKFKIDEITYIGFDTSYEKDLLKKKC